ncbi:S24 family peptidase [Sphingobacterium multivorum]|uniref:S24 family peptidase n=1 Tax=Sphingobacterium multivorum TaxID=28454 RepID=UPI003DA3BAB0
METARKRIIDFIENQKIAPKEFLLKTGLAKGFVDRSHQKSSASDVYLSKILEAYPSVNAEWLITGKGDMLKDGPQTQVYKLRGDRAIKHQQIPLYDLEASAGLVQLFQDGGSVEPIDTISIPNLPKCDGALYVVGDSMYPLLKSGDIVMYKQVHDLPNDFFWGEMYLVHINMDGDTYTTVKYIQRSDVGPEYIKLVSYNQHHSPKDIHLSRIRAAALVKASVRINSMM